MHPNEKAAKLEDLNSFLKDSKPIKFDGTHFILDFIHPKTKKAFTSRKDINIRPKILQLVTILFDCNRGCFWCNSSTTSMSHHVRSGNAKDCCYAKFEKSLEKSVKADYLKTQQ